MRNGGTFPIAMQDKAERCAKQTKVKQHRDPKRGVPNMVDLQDNEDTTVYTFAVDNKKQEKIEVTVGGCKLNVIVDSEASTNIIDKQT